MMKLINGRLIAILTIVSINVSGPADVFFIAPSADAQEAVVETAPQAMPVIENLPLDEKTDEGTDEETDASAQLVDQAVGPVEAAPTPVDAELRFNFSAANWKDVIIWFSEQSDLSLQADLYPSGTINFRDPTRSYSISQGLDVLNRLLLDRGFALVRSGRILKLIDLEQQNAAALLSEFAELVLPENLELRGRSDIVRSLFPLGSMTPDNAKVELAQLIGPAGRVIVLESARQVIVTETVEKLIAIRELLANATKAQSNVVEIILKHRAADELLELARPLLGLEPGENASEDLRISVGLYSDRIYATGVPSKLSLLEGIVEKADTQLQTPSGTTTEVASPTLKTHKIVSADPTVVFDVLQTLIAGTPDARISTDPKTNAIIAFARPETQEVIAKTIAELEGSASEFEIIDLQRLEPSQALLTINKFFGVTAEGGEGPIVDGDPITGRLWVRGTKEEIELVRNLITKLEGENSLGAMSDRIRILPYNGRAAEDALEQVEALWQITGRSNQIRTISPSSKSGSSTQGIPERRRLDQPPSRSEPSSDATRSDVDATRSDVDATRSARPVRGEVDEVRNGNRSTPYQFVTEQDDSVLAATESAGAGSDTDSETGRDQDARTIRSTTSSGAEIIIQMSPSGMIIASEDTEALDAFESLMQSVSQQSALPSALPTIFWLKYAKADVAAELLNSILGGAESSLDSLGSSISGGLGGGMLGGLMGMMGGSTSTSSSSTSVLTATGSVSIIPDARLNALIVQAGSADLQFIEMLLDKIDQQESPEDIETLARPALIPVIYQDAADVEKVVKSVFADKMGGGGSGGGGGGDGGRQQPQPSPQDFIAALRGGGGGGGRGGGNDAPKSEPAKIIVAVDARSNSLVVTATPQDFIKVRELVEALDQQGMDSEESVEVVTLGGGLKTDVVQKALESVLGKVTKSTSPSSNSSIPPAPPASSSGGAPSSDDIQRRIEMFRQMQSRGGGSPFGGGLPFGGGGSDGGRSGGGRGDGQPGGGRGGR